MSINTGSIIKKKICLLGDEGVGKTSLSNRFGNDSFSEEYKSTLGVKLFNKNIEYNGSSVNFIVWDLRGGLEFYKQNKYYYNGEFAHIVMGDITNPDSISNIPLYYGESRENYLSSKVFLSISKIDLPEYDLFEEDLSKVESSCSFEETFKTSSKTGQGVNEMFNRLAQLVIGE